MEKSHFYVTHTHTHTHTHIYTGFFCLPEFQSHNTLHLLLLRVNFIQLQRKSNNFHRLTIKTKRILRSKVGQIQVHTIMTCALRSSIKISWLENSTSRKRLTKNPLTHARVFLQSSFICNDTLWSLKYFSRQPKNLP